MPPDPALISALMRALENDPGSTQLRLHVAQLLLDAGAEASAMEHLVRVLAQEPTNLQALELAAKAADALGDGSRAAGYRKIRESLSQSEPVNSRDDSSFDRGESSQTLPIEGKSEAIAVPVGHEGEPSWWEVEDSGVTLADVGGT